MPCLLFITWVPLLRSSLRADFSSSLQVFHLFFSFFSNLIVALSFWILKALQYNNNHLSPPLVSDHLFWPWLQLSPLISFLLPQSNCIAYRYLTRYQLIPVVPGNGFSFAKQLQQSVILFGCLILLLSLIPTIYPLAPIPSRPFLFLTFHCTLLLSLSASIFTVGALTQPHTGPDPLTLGVKSLDSTTHSIGASSSLQP